MSLPKPESAAAVDVALSPNHGERAGRRKPDCLVLHYTGMESAKSALSWLCDPRSQVSCHYFVWENGRATQLVPEARRAWHAGASCWRDERDVNSASIGIEIANPGHDYGAPPFPDAQIEAVIALCKDLCLRYAVVPERVLAHSDVAPARKRDPGEVFPWPRLHAASVGHWVAPAPIGDDRGLRRGDSGEAVRELQALLARYGYEVGSTGLFETGTEQAVRAFQRHFRPQRVDGVADSSTAATLRALVGSLAGSGAD